jgi:hypothetical protein
VVHIATISTQYKPVTHADDTNIINSHPEFDCFQSLNDVLAGLNKWIKANKLTLNFGKTNCMKFA